MTQGDGGKGEGKQTAKEREVRYMDMEDAALKWTRNAGFTYKKRTDDEDGREVKRIDLSGWKDGQNVSRK